MFILSVILAKGKCSVNLISHIAQGKCKVYLVSHIVQGKCRVNLISQNEMKVIECSRFFVFQTHLREIIQNRKGGQPFSHKTTCHKLKYTSTKHNQNT